MGRGVYGTIMKLLKAENLPCTVTKTWMHTPTMKALRISSPEFVRERRPAEGEYLRCWFPHLICEAKILLATRRYLLKEAGVSKNFMHVHAYWAKGQAMGNTRDTVAIDA